MQCKCGRRIKKWQQKTHEGGVWHRRHILIQEYRRKGLSFAEIGRQVNLSRARVRSFFQSGANRD